MKDMVWLGGSPCAGKSTLAKRLASQCGLQLYHADDHFDHHCHLANQHQPLLQQITKLHPDEIWLIPVKAQLEREIQIYREEFAVILEDLQTMSSPAIAEGAALLPECVEPLVTEHSRAVYLIPSENFQRTHYAKREWARAVVAKTSQPEQAFENWMKRDVLFALEVKRQAETLGLPVIIVDGHQSLDDIETIVRHHLKLE